MHKSKPRTCSCTGAGEGGSQKLRCEVSFLMPKRDVCALRNVHETGRGGLLPTRVLNLLQKTPSRPRPGGSGRGSRGPTPRPCPSFAPGPLPLARPCLPWARGPLPPPAGSHAQLCQVQPHLCNTCILHPRGRALSEGEHGPAARAGAVAPGWHGFEPEPPPHSARESTPLLPGGSKTPPRVAAIK